MFRGGCDGGSRGGSSTGSGSGSGSDSGSIAYTSFAFHHDDESYAAGEQSHDTCEDEVEGGVGMLIVYGM
jgi:hypothetical protein